MDVLWNKIAGQIQMLIPGAYAGLLLIGIVAYISPSAVSAYRATLGESILVAVLVAIGISVFLLYRVIVGELALYPLRHRMVERIDGDYSYIKFLASEGVPRRFCRKVYSEIRADDSPDSVFSQSERGRLNLLHATYALFYITGLEFFGAALYVQMHKHGGIVLWFITGISLVFAFVADIRQDVWECHCMKQRRDKLLKLLTKLGFKQTDAEKAERLAA